MEKVRPHNPNIANHATLPILALGSGMENEAGIFAGTAVRADTALEARYCAPFIIFYYFIFHGRLHKK